MKKIYKIKYIDTFVTQKELREQIVAAKNEFRATKKFNWRNRDYLRYMTDISIEEVKIK